MKHILYEVYPVNFRQGTGGLHHSSSFNKKSLTIEIANDKIVSTEMVAVEATRKTFLSLG